MAELDPFARQMLAERVARNTGWSLFASLSRVDKVLRAGTGSRWHPQVAQAASEILADIVAAFAPFMDALKVAVAKFAEACRPVVAAMEEADRLPEGAIREVNPVTGEPTGTVFMNSGAALPTTFGGATLSVRYGPTGKPLPIKRGRDYELGPIHHATDGCTDHA